MLEKGRDEGALPDRAELCRIHELALEMIERSDDPEALLARILEEYEDRLSRLPADVFEGSAEPDGPPALRALMMFASQAAALKARADARAELARYAGELERSNALLREALGEVEAARHRLDGVLGTLDAGILILGAGGKIERANRAARELLAADGSAAAAGDPFRRLRDVAAGTDGEIELPGEDGSKRVLTVSRRRLRSNPPAEVVLLSDVTERDRRIEEQHRLQRLEGMMRTVAVLSHKINNPLTALLGRAQLLRGAASPADARIAEVIEQSALRIAALVRDLGNVVRDGGEDALEDLLSMDPPLARGQGEGGSPA